MVLVAIKHQVRDYDAWKAVYDTLPPTAVGARFARVNRSTGDPNTVLVVAGFDSDEGARAFREDPKLRAKMDSAGVVGEPRVEQYREVEAVEA